MAIEELVNYYAEYRIYCYNKGDKLKGIELRKKIHPLINLILKIDKVLSKEEYIDIVCDELEYLREDIVVNRITGDPIKELTVEPKWLFKKFCVLNDIDKEMVRRDSYQGIKYKKNADK